MSEAADEKRYGCGLLSAVFGRWPKKSGSLNSLPTADDQAQASKATTNSNSNSKRRKGSDETAFLDHSTSVSSTASQKPADRIISRPSPNHQTKAAPPSQNRPQAQQGRKSYDDNIGGQPIGRNAQQYYQGYGQNRKLAQGSTGISGELESMIADHQRSRCAGNFVRASSGNVMLYGNLGNLRQHGGVGNAGNSNNILDHLPKTAREGPQLQNGIYANNATGNIVKKSSEESENGAPPGSLCRAISTRMDPEQLKMMGNEDYKNGRFAEALALYDAAIAIDPKKASYRSNKSAALTALGRLLEAIFEGREAIRIDPFYQRAHNRLATLYLRLGEPDKTMYHYKQAGSEADPDLITKARNLQVHLNRCSESKRQRDWNTVVKETSLAISDGADSAPQIHTLKAEALLKLHRHQEADEVLSNGPNFEVEDCTNFFGPIGHASLLAIRAQVDLVGGRIDDAMAAAERAVKLDSNNKDANMILRRTKAVMAARNNGNCLFKAGRYQEACVAYGEGLDHDPYNSVLLCNRAACRSKLGQFERATEDCTTALNIRPSYSRARLRRADGYAKLGKWQAAIDDYEVLTRETPEDEEVSRALKEAKEQLKRQQGGKKEDTRVRTTN